MGQLIIPGQQQPPPSRVELGVSQDGMVFVFKIVIPMAGEIMHLMSHIDAGNFLDALTKMTDEGMTRRLQANMNEAVNGEVIRLGT